MKHKDHDIIVVGAGLAGVEAAWAASGFGRKVLLFEAKPKWFSAAHKSEKFAELVCSNSLKSEQEGHAIALLKEEMRSLGSLVMLAADQTKVPAGKALAVDREAFSEFITKKIEANSNIDIVREEIPSIEKLPFKEGKKIIIATGPLSSPSFIESVREMIGIDSLYFYDAIAPIVEKDSIDMDKAFFGSRYDVGTTKEGDYINCPLDKDLYYKFIEELLAAKKIEAHEFDKINCFEGCMPIEIMAERHKDALRHGPMKPMGIRNPNSEIKPYAVVQLRQDNLHATLYNIVGFQTRMTYTEQDRVFRLIPGLENAKFARYGSMHRNTYLNSPKILDGFLGLKHFPNVKFAGQMTGVEGYLESAATGIFAGISLCDKNILTPLPTTALGALLSHLSNSSPKNFIPMNMIWGIFPPASAEPTSKGPKKADRRAVLLDRARSDFKKWIKGLSLPQDFSLTCFG